MQDYSYAYSETFEIMLELSCCKYPRSDQLAEEWENNREALLKYIEQVNKHMCSLHYVSSQILGILNIYIYMPSCVH